MTALILTAPVPEPVPAQPDEPRVSDVVLEAQQITVSPLLVGLLLAAGVR